jgi:hypothetical protein
MRPQASEGEAQHGPFCGTGRFGIVECCWDRAFGPLTKREFVRSHRGCAGNPRFFDSDWQKPLRGLLLGQTGAAAAEFSNGM